MKNTFKKNNLELSQDKSGNLKPKVSGTGLERIAKAIASQWSKVL